MAICHGKCRHYSYTHSSSNGSVAQDLHGFCAKVGGRPALVLHSSDEPNELSQWQCHDDSTMSIIIMRPL